MAYELSSSLGSGGMNRVHITTSNAGSTQDQMYGGKFNSDGTKLAVPMTQRQGATGNNVKPGIDIYHSSSAGWTIQESIDTGGGEPGSYTMQQIEWYNDHEIWGMYGPNLSGSQIFRWVSDSSGWTSGYGFSQNRAVVHSVAQCQSFNFSPDKKAVVLFNSSNSSNDDKICVAVSGASPWSTTDTLDTNVSNDIDNAILGGKDENNNYKLFIASTLDDKIYNYNVDPTTADIAFPGAGTSRHYINGRSGHLLYWHEESKTLLVSDQSSTSVGGSAAVGRLYLYQSQSDGSAFMNSANSVEALDSAQVLLNTDPNLGARYASGSEDRIIFGAPYVYTSNFKQGNIQALESGSASGWKHTIIDGQMSAGKAGNIDISAKGAIVGNPGLYEVDEATGDVPGFFNNSFGNSTGNRKDHAGIFTIRQFDALDNSDATGPSVSSVAITSATNAANNTLNEGDVVSVTVTMDEATVVNTSGGTPFIALSVGGVSRNASYASGTGTTSLIFQYTIASSETTDSDGISIGSNALALNSGTMQDAAGNNATITHSAVSANSSFKVDTTAPTISSLSVAANNSTVTVTFSEDVYAGSNGTGDLTTGDFDLSLSGGNQANISLNASPSAISKTAQNIWVLTLNGTDLDSIALGTETLSVDALGNSAIFDLAGNAHTAAASTVSLNNTAAIADSVTSTIGGSGGTVKAGNTTVSPDVEITIPGGALSSNVSIGANVEDEFDPKTSGVTQAGGKVGVAHSQIVRLTPHGTTFDSAVTVKFRLIGSAAGSCPSNLQIWKRNSATGIWYQINRDTWSCSSGVITLSTTSFSDYAAIGGNNMARTKINNIQLAKLTEADKVLPEAINITGSASGLVTSVNDSDAFIIQQANSIAKHISGSALKTYFAGSGVNVTASAVNENYRLTFVDHQDTSQIGLAVDSDLLYNPSTNTLTVTKLGAFEAAGAINFSDEAMTNVNVDSGAIDGTAIGANSHTTGKFTTVDATTDFTIDGLVITADTITNDAALEVVSTGLTLNASLDIALSADGGNVTMDDGQGVTAFDFDVDGVELKMHDDSQITNYLSIAVGDNGATTIQTVDADAAAANLQITADGTVDIDSAGALTLDSGGAINLEPAAGSAILLDGTISVDAGVVTGATSITSTAFVGGISGGTLAGTTLVATGDVDLGNATSDTITATGRFDSDLVPSTDSARDLGTSALQWAEAHIDTGNIDTVVAENITASAIQVQQLDVVTINSITQSETTLEIDDKLIVSAVSASSANADGGGLRIGGGEDLQGHASVLWNHASSSLDLTIGEEAQLTLKDGSLLPSRNNDVDLGSTAIQFKDLHLTGTANIDSLVLADGVAVTSILDEDAFGSNSATALATQQSIKAYVQANGGSFFLEDDDGTEVNIVNSSEIKFIGDGITTNFTDVSNGDDGDPFDLTFTIDAAQTNITSILATDLKIGEDDETKIDFETADEIHFYAANAEQVYVADGVFGPQTDSDVDLGTTGARFKDAYVDSITVTNDVDIAGDLTLSAGADGALRFSAASSIKILDNSATSLVIEEADAAYLTFDTTNSSEQVIIHQNVSLSDKNLTNVGDINADSLSVDDAAVGLDIQFGGNTTLNKLTLTDNLADALNINEGGTSYLKFVTTNGSEQVVFGKGSTFAGTTIANLGTVSAATSITSTAFVGPIDGIVGGNTPAAGAFTTLDCTDGAFAVANLDIDGATDIGAALVDADLIVVDDGAGGTNRKSAVSRVPTYVFSKVSGDATIADGGALSLANDSVGSAELADSVAGAGVQVTDGVLSVVTVQDVFTSQSKGSGVGTLSDNLVTASLSQDAVTGSIQVYLNGMLQTPSGSVESEGNALYDYILATASFTDIDGGTYTHRNGPPRVLFAAAIDSDDVVQLRYLKL